MPWIQSCLPAAMVSTQIASSLLVLALVVVIIAYFRIAHGRSPALHALDERYAKGEISREDYLNLKKDLLSRR